MKEKIAKKIYLAMSGGVDSSVAAYLLRKQGYDVTGVYMKNWSEESFGGRFAKYCPWRVDLADVKKVCKILKIPVKVYNFEKEYNKKVIDYFFDGEKKGLTPNPDVVCNREIKFGLFLRKALKDGADMMATGHYARKIIKYKRQITNKFQIPNSLPSGDSPQRDKFYIVKAKDKNKDQSYFLCTLTQKQLARSLFPLGDFLKPEIRKIAKKLKLPTADKPESMGICFVGEVKLEEFLKARIKEKLGDIVTTEGTVIGRHKGLPFYTIGQRKGIDVGGGLPYYVVKKILKKNQLIVSRGSSAQLYSKKLTLKNMNWIAGEAPKLPISCKAVIRYRQDLQSARVKVNKRRVVEVVFTRPQRAVTPGQFCALYKKGVLLGGGEIN